MQYNQSSDWRNTLVGQFKNKQFSDFRNLLITNKKTLPKDLFHFNYGLSYLAERNASASRLHFQKGKVYSWSYDLYRAENSACQKLNCAKLDGSKSTVFEKFLINYYSVPILANCMLAITFILMLHFYFRRSKQRVKAYLIAFITLFSGHIFSTQNKIGISLENTYIYSGPSKLFSKKTHINSGTKIVVSENLKNWLQITRPKIYAGWVQRNQIGLIK